MVRVLRAAVVPIVLVLLISLAGVVLGRIYADELLVRVVAGAALGSVGVGVAARRLPSWAIAPLSVVALGAYTTWALKLAADRAGLTDPLLQVVTDALRNGIPRLLTAMIPVESTPDTVVVPVVAAWLAGLLGGEVALRSRRVLLGVVPAAVLYGGALYVVGPNAGSAGWPTLAFAGLVVLALAVTARSGLSEGGLSGGGAGLSGSGSASEGVPRAARMRTLAGAALGLVVVVGLVAAVGPWVGARVSATPVDPRRYVQPPQVDSLDESPLNRISGWALAPQQKLLDVGASGNGKGTTRLRLAVLPDYDGITWRVGATYRNAGRVLPAPAALTDAPVTHVTQQITVQELTGRLLPVVPTPTGVDGTRIAYDATTGTVIRPESLTQGLAYTVTSDVPDPDLNLLPTADVPSGDAVARFLKVGTGVPEQISRLSEQLADGNGAAYDRAAAIETFLAEHYKQVADAPSGHAYPNLEYFLFGPRDQGGQAGTSEQFAASFALLARLTGLPSRVVVGFNAPRKGGTVTGGDAIAWPEVLFDDLGWVAFDPMPKSDESPRPVEEDFTSKPSEPPPTSEAPPVKDTPSASAAAVLAEPAAAGRGGASAVVVASGASGSVLLLVVAAGLTVVVMRRGLRRRRLTGGAPDQRITGAWLEFTDALRLAGRPVPQHLAAAEVAAFAAGQQAVLPAPAGSVGDAAQQATAPPSTEATAQQATAPAPAGEAGSAGYAEGAGAVGWVRAATPPRGNGLPPLDQLVGAVNTVAFAPGAADEGQASRAGEQAVAYAEGLRSRRSWWRRAWWSVHPGPLRWDRRR
ncbi:DUF3488 and transglutaminase-like domain-containing protein [Winogradskya humida]|uniref:Transglutaminase-like domain-containing protein n=1 Tax=Winogradskya humida TaxID=113566 RepID=A0ABQ3ZEN6_9ACTN|nr:transglutaminase domain-containing protein [Actinoplanes humidus]GIE17021.1 hypothetical protein Ahu01nite_001230 [Actinoplanes humidus]